MNDDDRIIQIIPSTRGETAVFYEPDGHRWTVPVVAWALYAGGSVMEPLTATMEGDLCPAGEGASGWYLYQPEAEGLDWEEQEREAETRAREAESRARVLEAADRARAEAKRKGLDREEAANFVQQAIRRARQELDQ